MDKYTLTFAEWRQGDDNPVALAGMFRVCSGEVSFPVTVALTHDLPALLSPNSRTVLSDEELKQKLLSIGLPRLKVKLNNSERPKKNIDKIVLTELFTREDYELFKQTLPKRCRFQYAGDTGRMCLAGAAGDQLDGKTTSSLCDACNLPDDALRCTNLQHPAIIGSRTLGSSAHRQVASFLCDIQTTSPKCEGCIPGGSKCWRQDVDNTERIGQIAQDIAEHVVDELQYFHLGFRHAFGHAILRLNDLRSASKITSPCRTQEEFTTKVACLADFLNNLDLSAFEEDIDSNIGGTLQRLEAFLKMRDVPLDERTIRRLRRIVALRNSFPIHSGNTRFLAACQELQVEYPPVAWEEAWAVVLHNMWLSLHTLRLSLPTDS